RSHRALEPGSDRDQMGIAVLPLRETPASHALPHCRAPGAPWIELERHAGETRGDTDPQRFEICLFESPQLEEPPLTRRCRQRFERICFSGGEVPARNRERG